VKSTAITFELLITLIGRPGGAVFTMAGGTRSHSKQTARSNAQPSRSSTTSAKRADVDHDQRPDRVKISPQVQQAALNIFRDALRPTEEDVELLQEVKTHLYNRDFATAFSKQEYLRVYASRWSPSRALGYSEIFADIAGRIRVPSPSTQGEKVSTDIVCIGGGAGAEIAGLATWLSVDPPHGNVTRRIDAHFIDIAAWGNVLDALYEGIVQPPPLSKYASASVKESNVALLSRDAFSSRFSQIDVLNAPEGTLDPLFREADLVTLMFTLNELYSCSIPKTQLLLSRLTTSMRAGACLLVVDSPGSYSSLSINGAEKKYPIQWLLDHTMLMSDPQKRGADVTPKWSKLSSDESKWFRLPPGLEYPIALEHMRYQIHVYEKNEDQAAPDT
jgi:25S rRNA (uracil2843-N3)-methyltransferase